MGFLHPELLILAIPAGLVWWKTRGSDRAALVVRAIVAILLLLALAGPHLPTGTPGRDLVVVVDRSRSMADGSDESALELIRLAEEEREEGDRIAVVTFGARTEIERAPLGRDADRFQGFELDPAPDGSNLGAALDTALELIPDDRSGSILLLSDGENNGRDAVTSARRAFARGVRIDVRGFQRPDTSDLSVERFDLPGKVAVGEPFQFNVWVRSDRRVEAEFGLERSGKDLSSGRRVFEPGWNRMTFRDVLQRGGIAEYELTIGDELDRVPENNRGLGAVLASGAPALLVINDQGVEGTLVRALRQAGIPVATATPESARLDAVGLSGFRAVVLENVAAGRLGDGTDALVDFVLDRGGGLMVTGGRASFGVGGYYLSPLDPLLPVSMELRQEHRKVGVGLAIALDRSGSMAAPVGGGMTKMDLANLGTAAAIELLSPLDSVSVIAVDSAHHIIQELTPVTDVAALTSKVRRIKSQGGGIYTYTALLAAGQQLEKAGQFNRHIILFADAADSEEQDRCPELVARMRDMGVTLSVIALGTPGDPDAAFLRVIAEIGGGEAYFTQDPAELPRLFAMDTVTAARAAFIEEETAVTKLPDLFGVGALLDEGFPSLGGYNLTYLRPEAQAGLVTSDEYAAPIFAFMHQGLGRTAAYTGQIGGTHGGSVVAWPGFSTFFVTSARWLLGLEEPEEFFPSVRREGMEAVLTVEVDPEAPVPADISQLVARIATGDGGREELALERIDEYTFEARYPLAREGIALGTVEVSDGRAVTLPPIALPYSPEFERSPDVDRGEKVLRTVARESGGTLEVSAQELFRGDRGGDNWRLFSRELTLIALILMLVEIAGRRLALFGSLLGPLRRVGVQVAQATRGQFARAPREDAQAPVEPVRRVPTPEAPEPAGATKPASPSPRAKEGSVASALTQARRAARRKLDR